MSSKGVKSRQRSGKTYKAKTKNGQAEVFVLPPDLLHKLGINLETVDKIQSKENAKGEPLALNNANAQEHDDDAQKQTQSSLVRDQSILETACLMKKSVFLSPTFAASNSNLNPKENENSEIKTSIKCEIMEPLPSGTNTESEDHTIQNPDLNRDVNLKAQISELTMSLDLHKMKTPYPQNTNIADKCIQLDQELAVTDVMDILSESHRAESTDDHPDEAYSSDCSNSNMGPLEDLDTDISYIPENNFLIPPVPNHHKKKISIINEEILTPNQMSELKSLHSTKLSDLIPIPLNGLINESNTNEDGQPVATDSETIVLFDDKGNVIKNQTENLPTLNPEFSIEDIVILEGAPFQDSKIVNACENDQVLVNSTSNSDSQTGETRYSVSIDLEVTDIEEEMLEKFADKITRNDDNEILENIQKTEEDCLDRSITFEIINEVIQVAEDNKPLKEISEPLFVDDIETRSVSATEPREIQNVGDNIKTLDTINESKDVNSNTLILTDNITKTEDSEKSNDIDTEKATQEREIFCDEFQSSKYEINISRKNTHLKPSDIQNKNTNNVTCLVEEKTDGANKDVGTQNEYRNSEIAPKEHKISCNELEVSNYEKNETIENPKNTKQQLDTSESYESNKSLENVQLKNVDNVTLKIKKKEEYDGKSRGKAEANMAMTKNSAVPVEKIKEIAMYLSKFVRKHTNERNSINASRMEMPTKYLKNNSVTSKVHNIQGVEKPGGFEKDQEVNYKISTPIRMYIKNKRNISLAPQPSFVGDIKSNAAEVELNDASSEIELNVKLENHPQFSEFCNCSDFGRLAYYDSEGEYEHIHFWERKVIDCNCDVLFGMYSTEYNNYEKITEIQFQEGDNTAQESQGHVASICWNTFENSNCMKESENQMIDINALEEEIKPESMPNENITVRAAVDVRSIKQIARSIIVSENDSESCLEEDVTFNKTDASRPNIVRNEEIVVDTVTDKKSKDNVVSPNLVKKDDPQDKNVSALSDELIVFKNDIEMQILSKKEIMEQKQVVAEEKDVDDIDSAEPPRKKNVKCGVCEQVLAESEWTDHIEQEHCFIAWRAGSSIDLKDPKLVKKLQGKLKNAEILKCSLCDKEYIHSSKTFISHVEECLKANHQTRNIPNKKPVEATNFKTTEGSSVQTLLEESTTSQGANKCGVCKQDITDSQWLDHIAKKHNYLAWKDSECPWDLNNEQNLRLHLSTLAKQVGSFTCAKCGLTRKYPKQFLAHIQSCTNKNSENVKTVKKLQKRDSCNSLVSSDTSEGEQKRLLGDDTSENTETLEIQQKRISTKDPLTSEKSRTTKLELKRISSRDGSLETSERPVRRRKSIYSKVGTLENSETTELESKPKADALEKSVVPVRERRRVSFKDDISEKVETPTRGRKRISCNEDALEKKESFKEKSKHDTISNNDSLEKNKILTRKRKRISLKDAPFEKSEASKRQSNRTSCNDESFEKSETSAKKRRRISSKDEVLDKYETKTSKRERKHVSYKENVLETSEEPKKDNKKNSLSQENATSSEDELLSALSSAKKDQTQIKCGVCQELVKKSSWFEHMGKDHDYLTWKDGETKLDVNNDAAVFEHLHDILKEYGQLICSKCGLVRKYVKLFLHHIRICRGPVEAPQEEKSVEEKCEVCSEAVKSENWIQHVRKHLESMEIIKEDVLKSFCTIIINHTGSINCPKCGIISKRADSYLKHVQTCSSTCSSEDSVVCAVCSQLISRRKWLDHRMDNHYNVAWVVGETPINFTLSKEVDKLIKEYKNRYSKLVCRVCGISRASNIGFYAHVIVCGKSEEEVEIHKKLCSICNKKYLSVYEQPHLNAHKDQEMRKEQKLREIKTKQEKVEQSNVVETEDEPLVPGRRRAAQKARKVIENYKKAESQFSNACKCGFGADTAAELKSHKCVKQEKDFTDSDESAVVSSEEESEDSDVDSDISKEEQINSEEEDLDEDEGQSKRKRNKDCSALTSKIKRFPFTPDDPNSYLLNSCKEFYQRHYKTESFYPEWLECEWEIVPEERLSEYMPPLEQSCKFKLRDEQHWNTWSKFEAKKLKSHKLDTSIQTIFVGACVGCISWVPSVVGEEDGNGHFLSVIGHRGSDLPRTQVEDVQPQPGLIQIWDYGLFNKTPKFVLGIAHDYGTAWSMDWCPSGARQAMAGNAASARLGLLAVAFSTGSVFIFSVPYPSVIVKDNNLVYKLKPVVELRLAASNERKVQATSVAWTLRNKHETIMVGYGSGYTAFFDLTTESPLLRTEEDNMTVLYPYHDVRMSNACVTGVAMYPSIDRSEPESVCASSPTGAALAARAALRPRLQQTSGACANAIFQPIWPSAFFTGDDCGMTNYVNELEWFGCGRRLGVGELAAGCVHCARSVLASPPLLCAMRRHPTVDNITRQIVGEFQLSPLSMQPKKQDDLQIKIQPRTYEEIVEKYGIEARLDKKSLDRLTLARDPCPERFPLSDVSAMSFCPSPALHRKLAVALHCGIILIIHINV